MSFFDDSHVTDVGLQGSAGPSVGFFDMVSQGFQQQFRVDSARALDEELRNRWLESLRSLERNGGGRFDDPVDPLTYKAFAEFTQGQPISVFRTGTAGTGYGARLVDVDPTENPNFQKMLKANEAIKKLGNPDVKSFEQILEEVSQMQQSVEGETASMSERGGVKGMLGQLIGAIGGSFTTRDPLNIITAPIGAGRTVATRIASEMAIAGTVVGITEFGDVAPNRALAGLQERDPIYNIVAAALGAGVIRGGLIEPVAYGLRLRKARLAAEREDIDFDLRDSLLQQMFDTIDTPTSRAGGKALDDMIFLERNNPYGEGQAAQARFIAELQQVQRVMGGEPMTAVARVLPPLPYEYIKKTGDFEIVREQAPELYARMEASEAKVADNTQLIAEIESTVPVYRAGEGAQGGWFTTSKEYAQQLAERDEVPVWEARVRRDHPIFRDVNEVDPDMKLTYQTDFAPEEIRNARPLAVSVSQADELISARSARRVANEEYQAAYRAVEVEAARLREAQAAVEAAQQNEAVGIFAATQGLAFNWSALQYDNVAALVDRINAFNETLDEAALARFTRETVGEGEDAVEREVWRTDEGIDIGLREPVDPEFRFDTDDGEMSVAAAMRDLQDDADLDEAMRTCLL